MAAPKKIRTKANTASAPTAGIQVPVDTVTLTASVVQLQGTVNELISRVNALVTLYNAHTHSGVTAGADTSGTKATAAAVAVAGGAGVAATDLFTTS